MLERAVHHVGHGLEAAVRMPGRALRLAGRVLDLAHLVHVNERIQRPEVDAMEGASHREALALEPARGARDADDGSLMRGGSVRRGDAGKDGDVGDGDGWHVTASIAHGCKRNYLRRALPQ